MATARTSTHIKTVTAFSFSLINNICVLQVIFDLTWKREYESVLKIDKQWQRGMIVVPFRSDDTKKEKFRMRRNSVVNSSGEMKEAEKRGWKRMIKKEI